MKRLLILLLLFLSCQAQAENKTSWWEFLKTADEATGITDGLFTQTEREILSEYLLTQDVRRDYDDNAVKTKVGKHGKHKKQKPLPPGLQKKLARGGQLPPGWQKKVARGEVLDHSLYEISRDLPRGLISQLPKSPDGTSVRQIEDRVVRILDATGVILDVLTGN